MKGVATKSLRSRHLHSLKHKSFGNLTPVRLGHDQAMKKKKPRELRRLYSRHSYLKCVSTYQSHLPERPTVITSKATIIGISFAIVVLQTQQGSTQNNTSVRAPNRYQTSYSCNTGSRQHVIPAERSAPFHRKRLNSTSSHAMSVRMTRSFSRRKSRKYQLPYFLRL